MKSFLKHSLFSIGFIAGLLALTMIVSIALTPKDNTREAGIDEFTLNGVYAEPENTLDVIFAGDSTSYYGIMPLEIWKNAEIASYAAGSPRQFLCYTLPIIEKIYKTQSPKVIFIEATSLFYDVPFTDTIKIRLDKVCKILRYHDKWKTMKWDSLFAPVQYSHRQRDRGYVFSADIKPANTEGYAAPTDEKYSVSFRNRRDFDAIVRLCRENDAEIILFSVPNTAVWNMKMHNGTQAFANEMGLRYLDMNMHLEDMSFDWSTDTNDAGNHLNVFGAQKVSAYLAKYMQENLDLPNHGGDSAYAAWNDDLRAFEEFKQDELRKRDA